MCAPIARAGDWLSWRGPHGNGVADSDAPVHWDESGIDWTTAIPGRGCSTPIVVGDRMFLTTAVRIESDDDAAGAAGTSGDADDVNAKLERMRAERAIREQSFRVLCIDRSNGKVLWDKEVRRQLPHEAHNFRYGSYASRSPISDGEKLYVSFGSWGLYCLDFDGNVVWETDAGVELKMRKSHGEGSAPALHGDFLVHLYDHEGDSCMVAFDKNTGEELWRTPRDEPSTWAEPVILEHEGEMQIVASGENAVRGYKLETGEPLWQRPGLGRAVIPTPIHYADGGLVIAMTGHGGGANIMAIRLGGEGALADDAVVWSSPKGAAYTSTPLLYENDLFVLTDLGFLSCFDAESGEVHFFNKRLPRDSHLKASPVAAGGRMYVVTESGQLHILALTNEKVDVVASHRFEDQTFIASPVVVDGKLYLRSLERLYCISGSAPSEGPGDSERSGR